MEQLLETYDKNGYVTYEKLITEEYCNKIKTVLKEFPIKLKIPFYKESYGYGNLINEPLFDKLLQNEIFNKIITVLLDGSFELNHLIINNKIKLIGRDVEWHQELFNVKSYAPGFDINDNDKLLQIYLPLDDESEDNGTLKIVPGSHKLGILNHIDIVGPHFTHKRAVAFQDLNKLFKNHSIKNTLLKKGSAIFFNNLLVHSSGTNKSLNDRLSIVIGVRSTKKKLDLNILKGEEKLRKKILLNLLKEKITIIEMSNFEIGVKPKNTTWKSLYEEIPWYNKKIDDKKSYSIEELLTIDGHSISKTGMFTMEKWGFFIKEIKCNIDYDEKKQYSILEIGCGAGALLKSFENNSKIAGIDMSAKMIDIAKKALPDGNLLNCEAINMPYQNKEFDLILSHSCFQYFENLDYFEQVISKISNCIKVNGKIALTDIFNEEEKEKYISYRIQQIGKKKYDLQYKDLNHLYIKKQYFIDILIKYNFGNIKIVDAGFDDIKDKTQSFRYNVYATAN